MLCGVAMSQAGRILGVTHLVTGLVIIALAVPLILRRIKMNALYGVRIPKAFESESNWYAINEFGGKVLVLAGAAVSAAGLLAILWPPASPYSILLLAAAPVPVLLLGLLPILRFAKGL
jgi:uncharacterized membrane protein